MTSERSETSELGRLGAVFARRRWVWLPFLVVTPLVVFVGARQDPPKYSASAQVLLDHQNQLYAGIGDPTVWEPFRSMVTQTTLASLPAIAYDAAERLDSPEREGEAIYDETTVGELFGTDILVFTTVDRDPELARDIATAYARSYVEFRRAFDTESLAHTTNALSAELRRLARAGNTGGTLYAALLDKRRELEAAAVLQRRNVVVVRDADLGRQVEPRPTHDALAALVLAVVAGLGLAFVLDSLDRSLRSPGEIAEWLGLPLLATVPLAPRVRRSRRPLLTRPGSGLAAAAAMQLQLHHHLRGKDKPVQLIAVTGIDAVAGREPVAPRLALTLAQGGLRVAIVDLDVRSPSLHRLLGMSSVPGITDVVLGGATLGEVMRPVSIESDAFRTISLAPRPHSALEGRLEAITAGVVAPEAPDLLDGEPLARVVDELRERVDVVVLQSPPLLTTGDSLALLRHADGIVLVARSGRLTADAAAEASRLLAQVSATRLGVVVAQRRARDSSRTRLRARWPVARPA